MSAPAAGPPAVAPPAEAPPASAEGAAPPPPLRQLPFMVGLALLTGATLALEVLDTRLLSVLTWYSLAFLVIAMGLFGLTAGALRVYLRPDEYAPGVLASTLSRDARRFAWGVPVSYLLLLVVPLRIDPVLTTLALFLFFSGAIALPFIPAGSAVAAALTRTPFPVGRTYAVDLVGAALGAPLVAGLLSVLRGGTAILAVGWLGALAAWCFARAGEDHAARRRSRHALLGLGLLCLFDATNPFGFVPLWIKGRPELRVLIDAELWNTHSRVVVLKEATGPAALWGAGTACRPPVVSGRGAEIDGHAATPLYYVDGDLERLRGLDCDVTNAAHRIRPRGAAAIIGVGGSRDLQSALLAGHAPVVGLELNGRLLEVLRGPLGVRTGVPGHPAVKLIHDEARSWLARTPHRFTLIQMSLIDTWAATGAGAHALGENGLYTLEGWRIFLDRLEPGGVFTVSRWSTVETARLMALASGALLERGVARPAEHLALLASGLTSTLIVGRDPLTEADQQGLVDLAREKGFTVLTLPRQPSTAERLRQIVTAPDAASLERVALQPALDFRPPTDDRPFFFNVIRPRALFSPLPEVTRGTIEGNLIATRTLGLAFLSSVLLVAAAILVPLWRRARPEGRADPRLWPSLLYFALIGVGFMLVEIALLQRMSLVLGHPAYSLMVVLASLVAATGVGALVSDRLPLDRAPWCFVYPAVIVAVVVVLALGWPALAGAVEAARTPVRLGFAAGVCTALGLVLGVAFPAGMRLVRGSHHAESPWLWGINGVGSVLASSAALMIALEAGFTRLTLVGAACYALLLPCIWLLVRRGNAVAP